MFINMLTTRRKYKSITTASYIQSSPVSGMSRRQLKSDWVLPDYSSGYSKLSATLSECLRLVVTL